MLFFASPAVLCACLSATGCIATDTIEFQPEENFPPSVVSQPAALFPLNEIGELNLDDPVENQELPLEVIIRDPNIDQTLEYRIFLNPPPPPEPEQPSQDGEVLPSGFVERPTEFFVSYGQLQAGICNKIELVVVGAFASFVDPRRPAEEGDADNATWWVRVVDSENPPPVSQECQ